MNRNQVTKLNPVALLALATLSPAFGMNEGAGAAAQTTVTVRNNPDYAVNAPSFTLVSSDGQEIGVPEKVITDTFNGKPLSPTLSKLFGSGTKEMLERKASTAFPADELRQFIELLISTHILAGTRIDLDNQEIIEAFSKQLPSLTGDDIIHYPALLTIADYYGVSFLVQVIGYYLAHSSAVIEDFIQHAKDYKETFETIRYTIPVAIGTGNWLLQTTLRGHTDTVTSVAFSPNGQQVVSGSGDDTIKIWHKNPDGSFNPEPQTLRGHTISVYSVAFSPDGQQIVSGSEDRTINIWRKNPDGTFNPEPQTLRGHTHAVYSVTFSPDGQQIVSGSLDNTIKIWHKDPDGTFNTEPQTLRGHNGIVHSVAFSPDGQQIVSGSWDHTIKIWHKNPDGSFNPEPQTLRGHTGTVYSVTFSPNGQQIVSGSTDNTINIWHKDTNGTFNPEPQTLRGHTHAVNSVAFSPDGQQIVSGSWDQTIKIWHKDTNGTFNPEPQTLRGHTHAVFSVTFSPDGQQIVSGSTNNTINIWHKDLITIQCSLLQALLIEAIKQAPGMTLDIREETGANQVLREIAQSCIGTPAEEFVRAHVRMDWASHAGAGSSSSSATVTDQGESAGAQQ